MSRSSSRSGIALSCSTAACPPWGTAIRWWWWMTALRIRRGRGRRGSARRGTGAAAGQRRPRCRTEHRPAHCGDRRGGVPGQRFVPEPGWIERLAAHLADPAVAAAAPRMVAVPAGPGWAGRYTTAACCLDLGDAEARVVPGTRVAYVPTAALVVRRAALVQGAGAGSVFDPALRWGEDVDLVWRLHAAGWRIATTRRSGYRTTSPMAGLRCLPGDSATDLLRRRWRCGTPARCRRLCCTRGPR